MLELYVHIVNWIEEQIEKKQEGQDLVEYAILLALIALIVYLAVRYGGQAVNNIWMRISNALQGM